ncbi:MFS transporter [Aliamphritea spongicola]|nr:MFS transporter [Aliamphritea spongicola]
MVLRASLGLAITQGLLFFCTELWEVLALRLLQGALAGIITAVLCFANSITPTEKRSAVIGKLTSATAAGAILGPVIGGVLIQWLSFSALFATASMACLLIALVLAAGLKQPPLSASGEQKKKHRPDSVPSLNTQLIGLGLLVIFLLQTAKALPSSFFALYAESYLEITPFMTGLLFSSAGIGMMLSAPLWGVTLINYSRPVSRWY